MVESGEAAQVQQVIRDTYGFQVTEAFANDFIAFVDKAMKGDYADGD
jgi:hypothetical protein